MTKEEALVEVRKLVLIERALYIGDPCMIPRFALDIRLPKCKSGHIHWALNTLAHEGVTYTRHGEPGVQSYDRGVVKRWRVRISRQQAAEKCKGLGIDLTQVYGFHEDDLNSNRLSGRFLATPHYALPQL